MLALVCVRILLNAKAVKLCAIYLESIRSNIIDRASCVFPDPVTVPYRYDVWTVSGYCFADQPKTRHKLNFKSCLHRQTENNDLTTRN